MIKNREAFLGALAAKLGRPVRTEPIPSAKPVNDYALTRFADRSPDELLKMFFEISGSVNLADCRLTTAAGAARAVKDIAAELGDGEVLLSAEKALKDLGVTTEAIGPNAWEWGSVEGRKNAERASTSRTGVVWAENALAESGTMVLFSSVENGRSVSLLPQNTIFVVKKSAILPRLGMLSKKLHDRFAAGTPMPSCINLVGGPSSTADIELVKVVGVHGPLKAGYLVIEDL